MRRSLVLLGLVGLFAATRVFAAEGQRYRIELADGRQIVAADAPVQRGSIVTFRPYPGGALTGIPAEQVVRIEKGEVATFPAEAAESTIEPDEVRPLEPGEALDVGLTGEGISSSASEAPAGGAVAASPQPGVNPGYYAGYGGAVSPNGTLIGPDGLAPTTIAPNGFSATGAPTVIGPNGTPTLAPGVGSEVPMVGPNGTPVMSGTPQLTIGPNGTPVLSPDAQPVPSAPAPGH